MIESTNRNEACMQQPMRRLEFWSAYELLTEAKSWLATACKKNIFIINYLSNHNCRSPPGWGTTTSTPGLPLDQVPLTGPTATTWTSSTPHSGSAWPPPPGRNSIQNMDLMRSRWERSWWRCFIFLCKSPKIWDDSYQLPDRIGLHFF